MSEFHLPPLNPQKGEWEKATLSRRRFFALGFWAATGVTGLTIGGAGVRFLVGVSLEAKPQQWVEVGHIADLPAGQVHQARYQVRTTDAWREVEVKGLVYAVSDDGLEYTVLDATCTHLGCNVLWQEQAGRFACPCHGGFFDRAGQVISGPPPTPLQRLQTKIENGNLLALV